MKFHTLLAVAFQIFVLAVSVHAADVPKPPDRPNVLWIVMDDVGVELPCYGEKRSRRRTSTVLFARVPGSTGLF
jgi:hypothetical protein